MGIIPIIILTIIALIVVAIHIQTEDIKAKQKEEEEKKSFKQQARITAQQPFNAENADELIYHQLQLLNYNLDYMQDRQKEYFAKIDKRLDSIDFIVALIFFFGFVLPFVIKIIKVIFGVSIIDSLL